MSKVLFFNPPAHADVYASTHVSAVAPNYPSLTLATLAGHLAAGHRVRVIDLDFEADAVKALSAAVETFGPDIVAASATTPDYPAVRDIMRLVKSRYPAILTVVGGVHVTALPDEAGAEDSFDVIAIGESDTVIPEILSKPLSEVPGILWRDKASGKRIATPKRPLIRDLNALPYPAWDLFDIKRYRHSRLSARKNPVGLVETSRGCAFQCNFCSKLVFGSVHRVKEPKRVVDEIEYTLACGFREIHFSDDSFTQEIERAKEVCREILRRKLSFPWSLMNGIRADMVDAEFFALARRAGCWQVGFGIETGDQQVLDRIGKKASLADTERAVRLAERAGVNTFGFFIFGLDGETEESIRRTIAFAKSLPLDIAKFDICIPYPGTPYFAALEREGRIRSRQWERYNVHRIDEPLYDHPTVPWPTMRAYYKKAFREFYLRPAYIVRRSAKSLLKGDLLYDAYYFIQSGW